MAKKRSMRDILNDISRIKEAAESCNSWSEMETKLNLTYSQIKTTLSYYPAIESYVVKALESDSTAENESEHQVSIPSIVEKTYLKEPSRSEFNLFTNNKKYVLDTSICSIKQIDEMFFWLFATNSKIIITSVVNNELEKLKTQKEVRTTWKSVSALRANRILWWIASTPDRFETVSIPMYGTYDDRILEYCQCLNRDEVVLLTSDKHMAVDARVRGINVIFFSNIAENERIIEMKKKYVSSIPTGLTFKLNHTPMQEEWEEPSKPERITLSIGSFKRGVLVINQPEFKMRSQKVVVYKEGKRYTKGPIRLEKDMQVLNIQKKANSFEVLHVQITGIAPQNNCHVLFSRTILPGEKTGIEFYDNELNEFLKS